ncbi:hypothetical protein HYG82_21155 [Natrinema halophilum]|nr:hypothetical protein [Natrinema halophilum]UHQ95986.1 hypothetical protein HYG82_21155 [Natrinema halophilum]
MLEWARVLPRPLPRRGPRVEAGRHGVTVTDGIPNQSVSRQNEAVRDADHGAESRGELATVVLIDELRESHGRPGLYRQLVRLTYR